MRPITVWIGRTLSSSTTFIRSVAPGPRRYASGNPPCHSFGASGPLIVSRIARASRAESGALMIFGSETASSRGIRFAPGTDAQPGVSGSPGTMKSYGMPPDWMWLSLPHGPSG